MNIVDCWQNYGSVGEVRITSYAEVYINSTYNIKQSDTTNDILRVCICLFTGSCSSCSSPSSSSSTCSYSSSSVISIYIAHRRNNNASNALNVPSTVQKQTSLVYDENSQFARPAHANCFGTSSTLIQRQILSEYPMDISMSIDV